MRRALTVVMLIMLLTVPYSAAGSVLDGASRVFVGVDSYADSVPLKSYSLLALTSMVGKVQNESSIRGAIGVLANDLLSLQNPDGGWGYHANQISTPQDTALAVIALNNVLTVSQEFGVVTNSNAILNSLRAGGEYLLTSFSSPGWGYIPDSPPRFYPTVMALWALGTLGLKYTNSIVIKTAADFIAEARDLSPEYRALRLIALQAVDYPNITPYLLECRQLLSSDNLSEYQRAILTYAIVLHDPLDFEIGKSLAILEELGLKNDTYLLVNRGTPFMTESSLVSTAYAVMAFSSVSDVISRAYPDYSKSLVYDLYNELLSRQNPDGGWPLAKNGSSSAKATYYALLGILSRGNSSKAAVEDAVAWAKAHLPYARREAEIRGTITEDYYYTALILAKFGNLSSAEKGELINFTRSLELLPGRWRGLFGIPQPYETALGLNLLLSLGYDGEDIDEGAKWLLSVSTTGWDFCLSYRLPITAGGNVPVTIAVLEALSKVVPPEELAPHAEWLIEQRLPSGAWGYFGKRVNLLGEVYYANPSIEYTIRAVDVLERLGYDYSEDVLQWVLRNALDSDMNTVDIGLTLNFLSRFNFVPPTTLYEVVTALKEGTWYINYWRGYSSVAQEIASLLSQEVKAIPVEDNLAPSEGNHIIVAPIGFVNISRYNPSVQIESNGTALLVDGNSYSSSTSIVIVPGRTQDGGYVLIILAGREAVSGVSVLFTSGIYRYLHGNYMVLSASDSNGDGEIEPEEITLLRAG